MTGRGIGVGIRGLASSAAVFLIYAAIFYLLDHYDWGQAFVRFACLTSLLAVSLACRGTAHPDGGTRVELFAAVMLTVVFLERGIYISSDDLTNPPVVDIGLTTQNAARMLLIERENPYQSRTIAVLGDDPMYWGYKYGPTMALAYAACAITETHGVKLMNTLYLAISAVLVYRLGRGRGQVAREVRPGGPVSPCCSSPTVSGTNRSTRVPSTSSRSC